MGHSGLLSSRSPPPPAKVEFIVPGSAPDGIQVPYGPGGTRLSGPPVPGGTAAMTISFDASAAYYALNAHLQGDGDIACKTVATGPATGRDDHRRSNHLCAGPAARKPRPGWRSCPASDPGGLSPPFVQHSHDEGGLAAIW